MTNLVNEKKDIDEKNKLYHAEQTKFRENYKAALEK